MTTSVGYKSFVKLVFITAIITTLSGCGFHLRSNDTVPTQLQQLTLISSKYSELTRLVKLQLSYHEISLVADPDPSIPVLKISDEVIGSRTVSLYSDATAAEYELSYTVKVEVQLQEQAPQYFTVALQRDQLNNSQVALAKSRESERLIAELRQAAAEQIIRMLSQVEFH